MWPYEADVVLEERDVANDRTDLLALTAGARCQAACLPFDMAMSSGCCGATIRRRSAAVIIFDARLGAKAAFRPLAKGLFELQSGIDQPLPAVVVVSDEGR